MIKPAFKLKDMVRLTRAGFPGTPIDSAGIIVAVHKGTKRDGYAHRYTVMFENGRELATYESDIEATSGSMAVAWETCPECDASFRVPSGGVIPPHKFLNKPCPGSGTEV